MQNKKIICFAHAGASALEYLGWQRFFDDKFELLPMDLAGRGSRSDEPFYENMNELLDDIIKKISSIIYIGNYVMLGHSFGTIIIFEMMKRLVCNNLPLPEMLILMGGVPPYYLRLYEIHKLNDNAFINIMQKRYGGLEELLKYQELINYYLPVMRADMRVIETHSYERLERRWSVDMSVICGNTDESLGEGLVERWKDCTSGNCTMYEFDGGHFFHQEQPQAVAEKINMILLMQSRKS